MTAIIGALVLTAAALGLTAWSVASDQALDLLTPGPERVVRTLVGALAAHRPASATAQLAEALQPDAEARLSALDEELRRHHGDYRFDDAEVTQTGERAQVQARLRSSRGEAFSHSFALARDPSTRLWKVTALTR